MLDVYRWVECVWRYLQMDMTLHRKNTNGRWTASDNISKYSSDSIKCQFWTDIIDNWYQVGKVCKYDGYVPIYAHTGTSMAVFKIKLRHTCGINMDVVASQSPGKTVKRFFFCGLYPTTSFSSSSLLHFHPKDLWQRKMVPVQQLRITWSFTQELHPRRPFPNKLHSRGAFPKKFHPWSPLSKELHARGSFANKFHARHSFLWSRWVVECENLR